MADNDDDLFLMMNSTNTSTMEDTNICICNETIMNNNSTNNSTTAAAEELEEDDAAAIETDSETIRNTIVTYGGLLSFVWISFCYIRIRFPRAYTIRQWCTKLQSPLATKQYGFFSWMWKMNAITEIDIMDHCGMDALCFLRILRMGSKIAALGMINSIWLMALYKTSKDHDETIHISDRIVEVTITHVPPTSRRLIGTVIAAYLLFGYVMYLILVEFEWFIEKRHKYLSRRRPGNYTVYVRNIPTELRSNRRLANYFRKCLGSDCKPHAQVRLNVPNLVKIVQQRDIVLTNLSHSIEYQAKYGVSLKHRKSISHNGEDDEANVGGSSGGGGSARAIRSLVNNVAANVGVGGTTEEVDAIQHYQEELNELNTDITRRIETLLSPSPRNYNHHHHHSTTASTTGGGYYGGNASVTSSTIVPTQIRDSNYSMSKGGGGAGTAGNKFETLDEVNDNDVFDGIEVASNDELAMVVDNIRDNKDDDDDNNNKDHTTGSGSGNVISDGFKILSSGAAAVTSTAAATAALGVSVLTGPTEDGEPYSAGFCSFATLSGTQAALQMLHHETPFCMEIAEAPDPDDIFWDNVGRSHKELQVGMLTSQALTAILCLFWTVPISFFASMSNVAELRQEIDFIDKMLHVAPILEPMFALLAPLMVVLLNALLPMILEWLSMFEGPVSASVVQATLFTKLAIFMIIHTFFVSAVSGALAEITAQLQELASNPLSIIDLMSLSLPKQSTYFMQIVMIRTVIFITLEVTRIVPLIMALLRQHIGPNLSSRERSQTYMGLRPLDDPADPQNADNYSQLVFYFMVLLVYQVLAPLTSFVLWFVFGFVFIVFRHQYVFIYPKLPDSGGRTWTNFIRFVLTQMLMAEFTIVGLLGLKQSAIGVPLMVPLIIATILFNGYVRQQHFRVAEYLPSRECLQEDLKYNMNNNNNNTTTTNTSSTMSYTDGGGGGNYKNNNNNTSHMDFVHGAYVQPAMQVKEAEPELDDEFVYPEKYQQ